MSEYAGPAFPAGDCVTDLEGDAEESFDALHARTPLCLADSDHLFQALDTEQGGQPMTPGLDEVGEGAGGSGTTLGAASGGRWRHASAVQD